MSQPHLVAIIDSDHATVRVLQLALQGSGQYHIETYEECAKFLARLQDGRAPDVILLRLDAGGIDPFKDFSRLRMRVPGVPIVVISNSGSGEQSEEALRRGAVDYYTRPIDVRRLRQLLPRIIRCAGFDHNAARPQLRVQPMDEAKSDAVRQALIATGGNIMEAARFLGIGRTTLYKLMERYAITAADFGAKKT